MILPEMTSIMRWFMTKEKDYHDNVQSTHNQKHSIHHLMLVKILIPTDEIGLQDSCQIVLGVCWNNFYQLLGFWEYKQHKSPPQQITKPSLNLYEMVTILSYLKCHYIGKRAKDLGFLAGVLIWLLKSLEYFKVTLMNMSSFNE